MTKTDLVLAMSAIVQKKVKTYKQDFYVHDIPRLLNAKENQLFIWITRKNGTQLIDYDNVYMRNSNSRKEWNYFFENNLIEGLYMILIQKDNCRLSRANKENINFNIKRNSRTHDKNGRLVG